MSPVAIHNYVHYNPGLGAAPGSPTRVTSITRDAGATVSFRAPASQGSGSITHYVVTPYTGGSPQSATTVAVASLGSITGSDGSTYLQADVTGLANSTAYTFTVKARNSYGDSAESTASGANTPLAGLVFGDDFNGPAGQNLDPEWWVYAPRCGYLQQNEVQYYLGDHCVLDGSGNLLLIAEHTSYSGPRYPSDPSYPGSITQSWRSGACQSNTRTYAPSAGNTMTFQAKFQVNPDQCGPVLWPGLLWLEGQDYLEAWKTDPYQATWNTTGKAEIDVAEFRGSDSHGYYNAMCTNSSEIWDQHGEYVGDDLSAAQHIYAAEWKPGVRVRFTRDGSQTYLITSAVPTSGCEFFLLLYLQITAGTASSPQQCVIDYVRVFDQNLG